MKTNPNARRIRKIRTVLSALAIAALMTFELSTGYYCVSNLDKNPASSNTPPLGSIPNVSVGDFFVAVR